MPSLVEMRSRFLPDARSFEEFDSLFTQPRFAYMPRQIVAAWRDEESFQAGIRTRAASSRQEYEALMRNRAREVASFPKCSAHGDNAMQPPPNRRAAVRTGAC